MGRGQPENHPADHFLRASVNFRTLLMSISKFQAALTSHLYGISLLLLVCTFDTFQIMNSNGFSIQVCDSCRFDKMTWALRGIPVQGVTFDVWPDLWIYTFQLSNSFKKSETVGLFSGSLVEQLPAVPGIHLFSDFHPVDVVGWTAARCAWGSPFLNGRPSNSFK